MKRLAWVLVLVMMIGIALAGCGAAPAPSTTEKSAVQAETKAADATTPPAKDVKQMKITFVTPLIGHPVWLVAKDGMDGAAKEMGFKGEWVGPQGIDANEMVNQIENAIAQKVDGIVTMALNPEAFGPVLEKADKVGIPVVLVNSDAPNSPRLAYIGTDEKNLGTIGAKEIIKKLNGKAPKVITMQSTMDAKVANKMVEAYLEELKKTPGFELKAKESDDSDMLKAVDKFNTMFKTYPDANVVINVCGEGGPAAGKVIEENKLQDKITAVAIDDMKETVDYINSGVIYGTLTQNFYKMGYDACKLIIDFKKNGTKPAQVVNDSGSMFVSKANLATYKDDMKKPK